MNIIVYTLCYNEELILPYFLRYYEKIASKIVVYDNESTDNSLAILKNHPLVTIRTWNSGCEIRDDMYLSIKNNCWKDDNTKSKVPDWVFVVDMDEFIWSSNLFNQLHTYKKQSVGAIYSQGFEMFSSDFSFQYEGNIIDKVTQGIPSQWYCKLNVINPNAVIETDYGIGAHTASPKIRSGFGLLSSTSSDLKLLHMKYLNWEYFLKRNLAYQKRLSDYNKVNRVALNYLHTEGQLFENWKSVINHTDSYNVVHCTNKSYFPSLLMGL